MDSDFIVTLIGRLPEIFTYFIPGYVFVGVYRFVAHKKERKDVQHLFISSVLASLFIKCMLFLVDECFSISVKDGSYVYLGVACGFALLLGYVLGIVVPSHWFNSLLLKIKITRTTNKNFWEDVLEPGCWISVFSKNGEAQYLGQYIFVEETEREPLLGLSRVRILDKSGNVLKDYSDKKSEKQVIVINTKDFERIDIIYNDSKKKKTKKRWRKMLHFWKRIFSWLRNCCVIPEKNEQ